MSKARCYVVFVLMALLLGGCTPAVLKQEIPVSTNPMHARIYVNGQPVGQTPGTVSLERNRDHILTLVKENYRQEDVVIRKQYQADRVFLKAVQSGVNAGLFHKNAAMGISSGYSSMSRQEETGEAYVLVPPAVKVDLVPLRKPSPDDRGEQLSGAAPTPPSVPDGGPGRPAGPSAAAADVSPGETGLTTKDVLKAGIIAGAAVGAAQARPVEKKWETSSSSKSYTTADGTRVTEKSSTSVGVSVNPAGMVNALDILFK